MTHKCKWRVLHFVLNVHRAPGGVLDFGFDGGVPPRPRNPNPCLEVIKVPMFRDFAPGGHWPRKRVWGCATLKTPFSRLSCRSQGSHFKPKSQFTRPPFEKIWKFGTASIFAQMLVHKPPNLEIFSSQAPKAGNFQLTSPQIWKFSAHKPPLFRGKCQFASPTLRESGPHTPTWKKVECPPPGILLKIWTHV